MKTLSAVRLYSMRKVNRRSSRSVPMYARAAVRQRERRVVCRNTRHRFRRLNSVVDATKHRRESFIFVRDGIVSRHNSNRFNNCIELSIFFVKSCISRRGGRDLDFTVTTPNQLTPTQSDVNRSILTVYP